MAKNNFILKKDKSPRINCNAAVVVIDSDINKALKAFKNKMYNYGIIDTYKEKQIFLKESAKHHRDAPNSKTINKG